MRIIEVIPARQWRHLITGSTASIYGALPYTNPAHADLWRIEITGWTWRVDDGTVGLGRRPAETREEAEAIKKQFNERSHTHV